MAEKVSKAAVLIPILAGYYYSVDSYNNHTLYFKEMRQKQEFGKKGVFTGEEKEYTEVLGYYYEIDMMLKAMAKNYVYRKIESGEIKTIEEHIKAYQEITERLELIVKGKH